MPWQIEDHNGLYLPAVNCALDASRPAELAFVSHAHADHMARHREAICSPPTADLMAERLPSKRRRIRVQPFGETAPLSLDSTLTLHPAGHILGSAMALIEHPTHGRLLYTGDFKLRPGLTTEPCATPPADVVIMETTFGLPRYVFPANDDIKRDIVTFCGAALADHHVPVLLGYSLGRTQELLAALRSAGWPVMLHPSALAMTRIYADHGVAFPAYRELDPPAAAGHVVIMPAHALAASDLARHARLRTAVVTGWAIDSSTRYRSGTDAAFPLSDHSGYDDLLAFVDAVQPRRVYTVHGFAREFAATLRRRGVEAWALGQDNQLELSLD